MDELAGGLKKALFDCMVLIYVNCLAVDFKVFIGSPLLFWLLSVGFVGPFSVHLYLVWPVVLLSMFGYAGAWLGSS